MPRHLLDSVLDALTPVTSFLIPSGRGCPYAKSCPFFNKNCPTAERPLDQAYTCVNGTQPKLEDMPKATGPLRKATYSGAVFGMELALPH